MKNTKTTSYTIFEYNSEKQSYIRIGSIDALNASQACERFAKESGWKKKKNASLFAQLPICR